MTARIRITNCNVRRAVEVTTPNGLKVQLQEGEAQDFYVWEGSPGTLTVIELPASTLTLAEQVATLSKALEEEREKYKTRECRLIEMLAAGQLSGPKPERDIKLALQLRKVLADLEGV